MKYFGLLLLLSTFTINAHADLSSADQSALTQTQQTLTDPAKRQAAIANNRSALAADQNVQNLGGTKETTDAIYGLTAGIMENLAKDSGGDVAAMQKRLEEAAKNPEAFMNSLSAAQKKSLESIAQQIEAKRGPSNQP